MSHSRLIPRLDEAPGTSASQPPSLRSPIPLHASAPPSLARFPTVSAVASDTGSSRRSVQQRAGAVLRSEQVKSAQHDEVKAVLESKENRAGGGVATAPAEEHSSSTKSERDSVTTTTTSSSSLPVASEPSIDSLVQASAAVNCSVDIKTTATTATTTPPAATGSGDTVLNAASAASWSQQTVRTPLSSLRGPPSGAQGLAHVSGADSAPATRHGQVSEAEMTTVVSDSTVSAASTHNLVYSDGGSPVRSSMSHAPSLRLDGSRGRSDKDGNGVPLCEAGGGSERASPQSVAVPPASAAAAVAPSTVTQYPDLPPPSGLRDPVTLLQLIPLDLLLPPNREAAAAVPESALLLSRGPALASLGNERTPPVAAEPQSQTSLHQLDERSATLRYRRAFSQLRCATQPSSMLSRSHSWQRWRQEHTRNSVVSDAADALNNYSSNPKDSDDSHHDRKNDCVASAAATTALYATLGRVMTEIERWNHSSSPPPLPPFSSEGRTGNKATRASSPSPFPSSSFSPSRTAVQGRSVPSPPPSSQPQLAEAPTVLLGRLADVLAAAQQRQEEGEEDEEQQLLPPADPSLSMAGPDAVAPAVVPLLFFAGVVESPPDIQRCLLVSRTHAYLCELDGTVAYCAAICDVRQIVACAGHYMVWRFSSNASVLSMSPRFKTERGGSGCVQREMSSDGAFGAPAGVAASSSSSLPSSPPPSSPYDQRSARLPSPRSSGVLGGGGGLAAPCGSPPAPHSAAAPDSANRDEMADWVFRLVSVGPTSPPAVAASSSSSSSGAAAAAAAATSGADYSISGSASAASGSRCDDRSSEMRTHGVVFLLHVMCVLRTLPRLLRDALTAGSSSSPSFSSMAGGEKSRQTCAGVNRQGSRFAAPLSASAPTTSSRGSRLSPSRLHDRLDVMHVAGDRPARVPLLLEGPVGRQTTVRFIEQHWTTRYDQLPPSLRPRSLQPTQSQRGAPHSPVQSAAAATRTLMTTSDGGVGGVRVCYVESASCLPPIPVLLLEVCLSAEDGVAEMTELAEAALQQAHPSPTAAAAAAAAPPSTLSSPRSTAPGSAAVHGDAPAASAALRVRELASAAAQEAARAALSPAAWSVLQRLLPDREGVVSEGGAAAAVATTTTTVGANSGRVGSHETLGEAAPRQRVPATGAIASSIRVGDASGLHDARDTGAFATEPLVKEEGVSAFHATSFSPAEVAADASRRTESECSASPTNGSALSSSASEQRAARHTSGGEAAPSAVGNEEEVPSEEQPKRTAAVTGIVNGAASAAVELRARNGAPTPPSPLTGAEEAVARGSRGATARPTNQQSLAHHVEESERGEDESTTKSASLSSHEGRKTAATAAEALDGPPSHALAMAAASPPRLRRQRADERSAASPSQLQSAHAEVPAALPLSAPHTDSVDRAVSALAALPSPSALNLSELSPAVAAYEQRICHRPVRDRLVLRRRYIERLLQPPLRTSVCGVSQRNRPALRLMDREKSVLSLEDAATAEQRALDEYTERRAMTLADPEEVIDDLRGQRAIAELMYIQKLERSSSAM